MRLIEALYDRQLSFPGDSQFYTKMLENEDFLSISPQMYFLLKQQGRLSEIPAFFRVHLEDRFNQASLQNVFIASETERLVHCFEGRRIDVILLKGVSFARKYFGHIGARPTSDIDLLVRASDITAAMDCVKKSGFVVEEERIPGHFHRSFSKELPRSTIPLTVELHWDLLRRDTAAFDVDTFWKEAKSVEPFQHLKELSNQHVFYLICLHGWRHNLQSLKHFLDIIQLISVLKDELDFVSLLQEAAADQTLKRMVRTLSIVYREFPFLDSIVAFPAERIHTCWQYHARSFKRYIDFVDYQFFSYDTFHHSAIETIHWIKSDFIPALRFR